MKQEISILGLRKLKVMLLFLLVSLQAVSTTGSNVPSPAPDPTINAMAPLFIGDASNQSYLDALNKNQPTAYEEQWKVFRDNLRKLKTFGVKGISVDVWWGIVQRRSLNSYDWGYYRRLFETIRSEGLSIKAIMSTHRCGSNVGDNVFIPLPPGAFEEIAPEDPVSAVFESEAGNRSHEYISFFRTDRALPYYEAFWSSFLGEFRDIAGSFSAIAISMGPSGELHYPSYHQHDSAFSESKWPHRGFFQGAGAAGHRSYIEYLKSQFGSLAQLNKEFGRNYNHWNQVFFPQDINPAEFSKKLHSPWLRSPEGITLFNWYAETLRAHMTKMLRAAAQIVWRDADFGKTPISIKIPGIHWERNRLAELMNGLVSVQSIMDSEKGTMGLGYKPLFDEIAALQRSFTGHKIEIYTTAGSTPDEDLAATFSRGQSIVKAQADLAKALGIIIKLENALAGDLFDETRLEILDANFRMTDRAGLTLLRMTDLLWSPAALKKCEEWLRSKNPKPNS